MAVVRTEYQAEQLAAHYTVELGPRPARLHHLLLAPVFQRFARHFLQQILQLGGHSSLTHPVYRCGMYGIVWSAPPASIRTHLQLSLKEGKSSKGLSNNNNWRQSAVQKHVRVIFLKLPFL